MDIETTAANDSLGDDILRGAAAIGAHINETEKRTYYLAAKKLIPVGKQGAMLIGSKRTLNAFYAALAGGTLKLETGPPPQPPQPPAQTVDRRRLTKPPTRRRRPRRSAGRPTAEATPTP